MGGNSSKPAPPQPKAPTLSDTDKAKLDIKRQRDRLSKGEARLNMEAAALEDSAKKAVRQGDKTSAVRFLKLSKLKVKRREDIIAMITNLEGMLMQIDSAQDMAGVAKALEIGAACLKKLELEIPVERAERIMEDVDDALAAANEIDEVFSREMVGPGSSADAMASALGQEVERLLQAAERGPTAAAPASAPVPAVLPMPEIPSGAPVRARASSPARVAVAGS